MLQMPPRAALSSPFSVTDATNVVVCPLKNHDGSSCRKRCFGEKRYRSIQEHIRRAHPEHYIGKLPATEETFNLMVNTPPSERPPPPLEPPTNSYNPPGNTGYLNQVFYESDYPSGNTPRSSDEYRRSSLLPVESAAAALAQLHNFRAGSWDAEQENYSQPSPYQNSQSRRARFAPLLNDDSTIFDEDHFIHPDLGGSGRPPTLLASALAHSPPGRSSTLPPLNQPRPVKHGPNRARKSSVGENARRPKHERTRSKELKKRYSHDRKAFSAEPQAALLGKRWEDLIDAAASATEEDIREREDSRDRTPIPMPQASPRMFSRSSLPPLANSLHLFQQPTQASPLQRELTPPPQTAPQNPSADDLIPFPSVESSIDSSLSNTNTSSFTHSVSNSGSNFHIPPHGLDPSVTDSSPMSHPVGGHGHVHSHHGRPGTAGSILSLTNSGGGSIGIGGPVGNGMDAVQLYCAGCQRVSRMSRSFACTMCVCGLCEQCTDALLRERQNGKEVACPRCREVDGYFKRFNVDVR